MELDPSTTDVAFRQAWKTMPPIGTSLEPGGPHSEKDWWRALVYQVLDQLPSLPSIDRGAYFEDLFASYADPAAWVVFPEIPAVLDSLKNQGLPLFVLSNFDARLLPVLDGLGLSPYFEKIFYSEAIGHAKPSPESFAYALRQIGLPADECLHVGDDPSADWLGARRAGLRVFELDRSTQDLHALLEGPGVPDFSD